MDKIKKLIPSFIVLIYSSLISITKSPFIGDAAVFALLKGNYISILIDRYNQWTSRVVIEGILLLVLKNFNGVLWNLLNILMILLLYYSLNRIFNRYNKIYLMYVIASSIVLYTYKDMFSAGWSATTVNYLWPLALGVFSFIPIVDILYGDDKSNKFSFLNILSLIGLIISVNQEQCSALILGFSILLLIYYYLKNKKINKMILMYSIISLLAIIFALTSPGNLNRLDFETIRWFNDFNDLGFIDKFLLSLNNTFDILLSRINYIGVLFYLTLVYYYLRNKKYFSLVLSIILLIGTLVIPRLDIFNLNTIYSLSYVENTSVIGLLHLNSINYIVSIIISIIYLIGTVFLLWRVNNKNSKLLYPIMFIAAISSRMIIGFSPTIFASSYRTGIFMNFLLVMIVLMIFDSISFTKKEEKCISIVMILFMVFKFIISYMK